MITLASLHTSLFDDHCLGTMAKEGCYLLSALLLGDSSNISTFVWRYDSELEVLQESRCFRGEYFLLFFDFLLPIG